MSSRMWDSADDFSNIEPRSFAMHGVAFFRFTDNFMISAALQESYYRLVPKATRSLFRVFHRLGEY
jgi:hypothetical protein